MMIKIISYYFQYNFNVNIDMLLSFYFSVAHEKEVKELQAAQQEVARQREAALREVAELKVQLKMAEETRDTIRRDLIEANRKIREGERYD